MSALTDVVDAQCAEIESLRAQLAESQRETKVAWCRTDTLENYATSRLCSDHNGKWQRGTCVMCELEKAQRDRDEDREYLAAAMIRCSFATADGDTLRALVDELGPQVMRQWEKLAEAQRERDKLQGNMGELMRRANEIIGERDKLRESHKTLHRRCQEAETALPSYRKLVALPPDGDGVRFANGNMGRALLASVASKQADQIDSLREFVAAYDAWWERPGNDRTYLAMLEKRAAVGE